MAVDYTIKVTYDGKTKRLVMDVPFFLNDAIREFPSRRFDPKSKKWKVPLVKSNIEHMNSVRHKYQFKIDDEAQDAISRYQQISAAPVKQDFPRHVYDFHKAKLKYDPMLHQNAMLDMAWGLKCCAWFAKMGTGKTYATVHLACARFMGGQIDRHLVIAPATLAKTWEKEYAKYATCDVDLRIHATNAKWMPEFCDTAPNGKFKVLIASVESLSVSPRAYDSVCAFMVGARVFTTVDESSRIKNPKAICTDKVIKLGSCSEYRSVLNGTPIALGIEDLWTQYEFLDPNIIGSGDYWAYKTRYLTMGGYENKKVIGYQNIDELMKLIAPYTIEVGKEVLNLPPKVYKKIYIEATKHQRDLFKLVVKGANSALDPSITIKVDNTLERALRLRQIVGGWLPRAHPREVEVDGEITVEYTTIPEPLDVNPKLNALLDIIDNNLTGSKFIIWSSMVHEIKSIRDILIGKYGDDAVRCYFGEVSKDERSRIEDAYCNDPKMRFFVGNPAAAGLGLTLISGINDVMIYYSTTEAYIYRAQSEDRAHRIGQNNTVTIIDLVMEKSVDVIIQASIERKMGIEEYIIDQIRRGASVEDILMGVDTD